MAINANTTVSNTTDANAPALDRITKQITPPNSNTTAPATNSNNTPGAVTKNSDGSTTTVTTETTNGVTNTVTTTVPPSGAASNANVSNTTIEHGPPKEQLPTGEGEGFTLGKPDGNGGFIDNAGNPVDANGVPIFPAPSEVYSGNTYKPQPVPTKESTSPADWRVRLSLAPGATYLYKDREITDDDILYPLKSTNGVIFPYLPQINQTYKANYNSVDIVHTNYRNWFYSHSSIDDITIVADFTAQDNTEAKYMLAVIHFFKSVTKMFYGQDSNPRGGTPPPLCYLTGLGAYQFNNHPILVSSFSYNLPNDVDYIRTDTSSWFDGGGMGSMAKKGKPKGNIFTKFLSDHRLSGAKLNKNATPPQPNFSSITTKGNNITYVPTKLQIQISGYPVVTRKDISENFKLAGKDGYASGALTKNNGMW